MIIYVIINVQNFQWLMIVVTEYGYVSDITITDKGWVIVYSNPKK